MLDVAVCRTLGRMRVDVAFQGPSIGLTALFGPSGSGKSTVVNAIAGLLRPEAGHVRLGARTFFDSARRIDVPVHLRRIGYVFQDARLFPHMRVRDNLLYGFHRAPSDERHIEFAHVVELLGIGNLLDRRPHALSGGERQRIALGRALLAQPRLLLMDEPLAALDPGRKAEILPYFERLRDDIGIPMIYVSHSIEEVVRLADTVVVLDHGHVTAAGDVADIMARLDLFPPDSPYEAGAVIASTVIEHDEAYALSRLAFAGGELLVPRVDRAIGSPLRVRIRARDVMIALNRPDDLSALNMLPGVIEELRLADDGSADVQIAIGATRMVSRLTRQSVARLTLSPGKQVFAIIKSVAIDGRGRAGLASDL
jgi:molybdate transport system ATP-binding protein